MTRLLKTGLLFALMFFAAIAASAGETASLSHFVDSKGAISLPADFRTRWAHLGTWVVPTAILPGPELEQTAPGSGFHDVYTQPESLKAFQKTGRWPDGAIIIQEVRSIEWDDLPTGHVMVEGDPLKWFVMIRDDKGRFPKNANWGDGWGWAMFKAGDAKTNVSTDYRRNCRSCHEVAKTTDWIFLQGYPALRQGSGR